MSIYIISNNALKKSDYYKVGMTKNSREELLVRYSTSYGVTTEILMFQRNNSVLKVSTIEQLIFKDLDKYREDKANEIFICKLEKLKKVVKLFTKKEKGTTLEERCANAIPKFTPSNRKYRMKILSIIHRLVKGLIPK